MSAVTPQQPKKKIVPYIQQPKDAAGRATDYLRTEARKYDLSVQTELLKAEKAHLSDAKDVEKDALEQAQYFMYLRDWTLAGIPKPREASAPPAQVSVPAQAPQQRQGR